MAMHAVKIIFGLIGFRRVRMAENDNAPVEIMIQAESDSEALVSLDPFQDNEQDKR